MEEFVKIIKLSYFEANSTGAGTMKSPKDGKKYLRFIIHLSLDGSRPLCKNTAFYEFYEVITDDFRYPDFMRCTACTLFLQKDGYTWHNINQKPVRVWE